MEDVPPAHAALGDRAVGGGDLVERYDGVHPCRQVPARCGVEELGEPGAVGLGHDHSDGDAALFCGRRAWLHADEEAAVADQRDALLLEHGTVGDRVPAGRGFCGEVGAEAAHERLVLGPGQSGDPPAAVLGERDDVPPTAPAAPVTSRFRPPPSPSRSTIWAAARPLSGTVAAVARSRPSGTRAVSRGRDDELLGVRAEVAVEPSDQPGDAAADREVDVRAGRGDGAGEVPAQAGVVGLVDQPEPVEHARRRAPGRRG